MHAPPTSVDRVRKAFLAIAVASLGGAGAQAQQAAPDRFHAAVHDRDAEAPAAPLVRVAAGTMIGGLVGAAIGGLGGAAIGQVETRQEGFISASEALGVIGVAVLYPVGAAVGARLAATVDDARPELGRLVLVSCLSAVAGGIIWNRICEGFERPESMRSWYLGAGAGVLTHWAATSVAARNAPRVRPEPPAPPPVPRD